MSADDLVERLLDRDAVVIAGLFHAIPTMREAAEEITSLRASLATARLALEAHKAASFSVYGTADHIRLLRIAIDLTNAALASPTGGETKLIEPIDSVGLRGARQQAIAEHASMLPTPPHPEAKAEPVALHPAQMSNSQLALALDNYVRWTVLEPSTQDLLNNSAQRLRALPPSDEKGVEIDQFMIDAGAQALVDDMWHPPQRLATINNTDARRYRRQAEAVLRAALAQAKQHD